MQRSGVDFTLESLKLDTATTFLFKMHGSASDERIAGDARDNLVITEDDYVDFMVNAGGPLNPNFPPPALLAEYKERRFLFLGYSLRDWNFRVFLRLLSQRNAMSGLAGRKHWAVQLNPNPVDVELWGRRNVDVYDGDLVEFTVRLGAALKGDDK